MATNISDFKVFERTRRAKVSEGSYGLGMFFTNAPLGEGANRLLVNFDIENQGTILKPRKGLKVTQRYRENTGTTLGNIFLDSRRLRIGVKDVEQIIDMSGSEHDNALMNTPLYKGNTGVFTVDKSSGTADTVPRYDGERRLSSPFTNFNRRPLAKEIHGEPLEYNMSFGTDTRFVSPVGTFAWNNGYFFFAQNSSSLEYVLRYTKYHEENERFQFENISPKQLTPREAGMWGYNMLLEDPYFFENRDSVGSITVTGISPFFGEDLIDYNAYQNVLTEDASFYSTTRLTVLETGLFSATAISSKFTHKSDAFDSILPDKQYALTRVRPDRIELLFYDSDKNYLGEENVVVLEDGESTILFTTHPDAHFVKMNNHHTSSSNEVLSSIPILQALFETAHLDFNLAFGAKVGDTVQFRCNYAAEIGRVYEVVWQIRTGNREQWEEMGTVGTYTVPITPDLPEIVSPPFSITNERVEVRVKFFRKEEQEVSELPEQAFPAFFEFDREAYGSTANVKPVKYNLALSTGMTYWRNRLVVHGVLEEPTLIFMSEVDDPSYFPYPDNIVIFDEPVIAVEPFLDDLLVFTTTKLHQVTLNPDGLTFTQKCLQTNLDIKDWDTHLIQVVRNMVFFKSGNYYYMIVPSQRVGGVELAIAPISKPVEYFLDNFPIEVRRTLDKLYDTTIDCALVHYFNYLSHEDVHNTYVYQVDTAPGADPIYIYFTLLYNTVQRTWRTYVFEDWSPLVPHTRDATRKGSLIARTISHTSERNYQVREYVGDPEDTYFGSSQSTENIITPTYNNYQLLDTGYREHSTDHKKRYRELQLKLNNISQELLSFENTFYIDGKEFDTLTAPNVYLEGTEPEPVNGISTPSEWVVESCGVPNALWKIRMPIYGKGYSGRWVLVSRNTKEYELLSNSWVFRQLNSR